MQNYYCKCCGDVVIKAETGSKIKKDLVMICLTCVDRFVSNNNKQYNTNQTKTPFNFTGNEFGNLFGNIFNK